MAQALRPLKRENLRDSVKRAIRSAIISGEMEPGRVYSAPTLGETFGVSPTPVREAMLDLVREGLVISLPNKGFRVTEVSEADLDDVAQLRLLIEPPMARQVVGAVDPAGIDRLREAAQRIVDAARAGDLIEYVSCDLEFHLTLLSYAGNKLLLEVVTDLRNKTRLLGLLPLLESGKLIESAEEHHVIMDLVEAGDADRVEAYLRRHIGHVRGLWAAQPED
jgi:DNA-binding GntR family transcriptional regulator